jgi:hypothetical protein
MLSVNKLYGVLNLIRCIKFDSYYLLIIFLIDVGRFKNKLLY